MSRVGTRDGKRLWVGSFRRSGPGRSASRSCPVRSTGGPTVGTWVPVSVSGSAVSVPRLPRRFGGPREGWLGRGVARGATARWIPRRRSTFLADACISKPSRVRSSRSQRPPVSAARARRPAARFEKTVHPTHPPDDDGVRQPSSRSVRRPHAAPVTSASRIAERGHMRRARVTNSG